MLVVYTFQERAHATVHDGYKTTIIIYFLKTSINPNLRHSSPGLMCLLLVSPVSSGHRIFEAVGYSARLHCQVDVEVFVFVYELLSIKSNVFVKSSEQAGFIKKQIKLINL